MTAIFAVFLRILVLCLILFSLGLQAEDKVVKLVVAAPHGFPNFTESQLYEDTVSGLLASGYDVEYVEYPMLRTLKFLHDGKIDLIMGRRDHTVMSESDFLTRVPTPVYRMTIDLYVMPENANASKEVLCDGYWGISPEQAAVEKLIANYLGCEGRPNVVWKSNVLERIRMLQAGHIMLIPAPDGFAELLYEHVPELHRITPPLLDDNMYFYLSNNSKVKIEAINSALIRWLEINQAEKAESRKESVN